MPCIIQGDAWHAERDSTAAVAAAAGRPGSGGIPPGSGGIPTRVGWYLWGQPSFCLVRRFWVGGGGGSKSAAMALVYV